MNEEKIISPIKWNPPVQQRGIKRVAKILDAAGELIIKNRSLHIKMTQVAKVAEIPIGSVYQFFPTRASLLHRLFELEMRKIDSLLKSEPHSRERSSNAIELVESVIKKSLQIVEENPLLHLMWVGASSLPEIRQADLANTKSNAEALAIQLSSIPGTRQSDQKKIEAFAFLVCDYWGALVQLYVEMGKSEKRDMIVVEFIEMIRCRLEKFTT